MADRYQSEERWRQSRPQRGSSQSEQFQSDYGRDDERSQMGDSWRAESAQQSGWQSDPRYGGEREGSFGGGYGQGNNSFDGGYRQQRPRQEGREYGRDIPNRAPASGREAAEEARELFARGAGSQLAASHGEWHDNDRYGRGRYGARHAGGSSSHGGGFLERAEETVSSWFGGGDDDRSSSNRNSHRGRGPANYTRSDERVLEDACDALTQDHWVDARNVQVTVQNGELTLDGTVASRDEKRRAEDCVDRLSGVKHVQNNLRVQEGSTFSGSSAAGGTQTPPTGGSI